MDRVCLIEGCGAPHVARGYCRKHYSRWYVTGDTVLTRLYGAPVGERLRSKLVATENGCLEFTGWRDARGYGRFKVDGQMRKPHRVAYEVWVGPIPPGMHVCHHCDNPPCCNPEHLFVGTHGDNMADMISKGRANTDGLGSDRAGIGEKLRARAAQIRAGKALAAGYPTDYKLCSRCGQFKAPDEFGPNAGRSDGLQTYCRADRSS